MKKWIIITLIIILLGLVALGVISSDRAKNNGTMNVSSFDVASENMINVDNQVIDKSVRIKKAVLSKNGFIVIHKDSSGAPGAVVGTSNLLEPGDYSGIEIDISEEVKNERKFYAMLHEDNGDGIFNTHEDSPVIDKEDSIVFVSFKSLSN